jgi:lipopolysaccharide cholinephosphotransferase
MKVDLPQATGNLRKAQLRMLEILVEIDKLCRKNDIKYWLDFGTLLGAVRHGGFIPWDDDLDICVAYEDYDRFQQVCREQLPDDLFLQTKESEPESGMGNGMLKIRDKRSLYIHNFESFRKRYCKGCFIDVFQCLPYADMPKGLYRYLSRRIALANGFGRYASLCSLKNLICYFVYPVSYYFHLAVLKLWMGHGKNYNLRPEHYAYGRYSAQTTFFPLSEIEFEGHMFFAPGNPEQRLKDYFGDYMKIPSVENRRSHAAYVFVDNTEGVVSY